MTMNLPIENLSPFARIAQIYCPNISEQLIDRKEEYQFKSTNLPKYVFTNFYILLLCLGILILLLIGTFLSYLIPIRMIIFSLQHKFNFLNLFMVII
jgi:hypothetical protein